MAVIGIDLGTTNSLAAVYRDGATELIHNGLGNVLTPSVVSMDDNGGILVGAVARERLVSHPDRTAASFKRFMGTDKRFPVGDRDFTPQELSSFVLRQLKEDASRYLDEEVTEAVISVPAYFNDHQRYATREAGLLAGLKVERLVNEPSAAALAGSILTGEDEQSFLIFDFGGGTLDVSVVDCFENIIEVVAVSGDNQLGGNDFDCAIAEYFCESHGLSFREMEAAQRAMLLRLSEKCKRELTEREKTCLRFTVDGEEKGLFLTNEMLVRRSADLFDRASKAIHRVLKDSKRDINEAGQVVLVGGSGKMPAIFYFLEQFFGRRPVTIGSPDEIVARGAGIYAGIKDRREGIRDLVLTDICPFTLGTGICNRQNRRRPVMSPLIERNSILPTSKRGLYTNSYDFQENVTIGVYEGEAYYCDENLDLGGVDMNLIPVREGKAMLEVCFSYDINGILQVEVTDHMKHEQKQKVFVSNRVQMTRKELKARLEELERYKIKPEGNAINALVLAKGERLFKETTGRERELVQEAMGRFRDALASRDRQEIEHLRREIITIFGQLEDG